MYFCIKFVVFKPFFLSVKLQVLFIMQANLVTSLLIKLIVLLYAYFTVALKFPFMDLNGAGGWTEFSTFNLPYLLKACTFSMHRKMSVVLAIVKCLQLREIRKGKCQLKYLLKRTKMKIKSIMVIVFLVFSLYNECC